MNWYVYIILCSDNSLYTGITTDIDRRFKQHSNGSGAKYFRGRQPIKVVYLEDGHNHASATAKESLIKKTKRAGKLLLLHEQLTGVAG